MDRDTQPSDEAQDLLDELELELMAIRQEVAQNTQSDAAKPPRRPEPAPVASPARTLDPRVPHLDAVAPRTLSAAPAPGPQSTRDSLKRRLAALSIVK